MMDKSAIQQIQLAQALDAAQEALEGQHLAKPVVALPCEMKLHDLEEFAAFKTAFTGRFATSSLNDFAHYTLTNNEAGSQCFVSDGKLAASVIFDLGDAKAAGHCRHKAELEMQRTAEYRALLQINGDSLSQRGFAEFMEDWADFITPLDCEGEVVHITKAIGAVRRVTIEAHASSEHDVQDFRSSRSALESVEAKTDNGLPAELLFQCRPSVDLPEFNFYVRVSLLTGGSAPKFTLRVKRYEKLVEEIQDAFKALVVEKLEGKLPVFLGNFQP